MVNNLATVPILKPHLLHEMNVKLSTLETTQKKTQTDLDIPWSHIDL